LLIRSKDDVISNHYARSGTFRVLCQHSGAGPAPPEMGMWQFVMSPVMSCRWHASPLYHWQLVTAPSSTPHAWPFSMRVDFQGISTADIRGKYSVIGLCLSNTKYRPLTNAIFGLHSNLPFYRVGYPFYMISLIINIAVLIRES
jgi:hypothetical protein